MGRPESQLTPVQAPGHPTFYRPAEVADMLHCSEWWLKEQARKRRIPFAWIGGGYRFTNEHITEMARLFEVRPIEPAEAPPVSRSTPQRPITSGTESVTQLIARIPRRARTAAARAAA